MRLKDIRMLPASIVRIPEMDELLYAEQAEFDLIAAALADIIAQSSINSATHTLSRYEKIFDISYLRSVGIEERRTALMVKLRARHPMTVKHMEELVRFITGCDNKITEYYADYAFKITIFGEPGSGKSTFLKEQIELLKPAHLGCLYFAIMDALEVISQGDMLSRVAYRSNFGGRLGISSIFWDSGDHWDTGEHWDDETKLYIKTRMALRQQVGYTPVINRYWDCGVLWDAGIMCDRVNGTDMLARSVFRIDSVKTGSQTVGAAYAETTTHKWDKAYTWDTAYNWDSSTVVSQATL